jgi:hypothetical protein
MITSGIESAERRAKTNSAPQIISNMCNKHNARAKSSPRAVANRAVNYFERNNISLMARLRFIVGCVCNYQHWCHCTDSINDYSALKAFVGREICFASLCSAN